jgi:hypothetical protein
MMTSANQIIAQARTEQVEQMLLASGWRSIDGGDGWIAPEHFREELAREVGRGSVHLWTAIAAQVQFDRAVCRDLHASA